MKTFAIIKDGVVDNLIVCDTLENANLAVNGIVEEIDGQSVISLPEVLTYECVEFTTPAIGDTYANGTFIKVGE
jgi:hypothetical protein